MEIFYSRAVFFNKNGPTDRTGCEFLARRRTLPADGFELIDIRQTNISEMDLDYAKSAVGSYEGLFSRRAMKFREWGLHEKQLGESDYRDLILREYTNKVILRSQKK